MEETLLSILAGEDRTPAKEGRGLELRLLPAKALLEARREAEGLGLNHDERALAANACLLARALWKRGKPAFESGEAVLSGLTPGQIESLSKQWAEWNRWENPSAEDGQKRVNAIKKALSTRLMSALNGVCSKSSAHFPRRNGHGR